MDAAVPSSQLNTSFSSKSEGALNLSTDGKYLTFMDYAAAPDAVDVSNANTPGVVDPTNPVPGTYYRAVAQLSAQRASSRSPRPTPTAATTAGPRSRPRSTGSTYIYTAGNAGNGSNPQPDGVILGAGAQIITPSTCPSRSRRPGRQHRSAASTSPQLGDKADKIGKDDNFRGLTIFNNVLYYTKGSGGNGVNTVYFLDTTGKACPNGVGLPAAGRRAADHAAGVRPVHAAVDRPAQQHVHPEGLPDRARQGATDVSDYPFGLWFANADHAVRRRRGRRRQRRTRDRHLHRGRRVRPRPACRSGSSTRDRAVEAAPTCCRTG